MQKALLPLLFISFSAHAQPIIEFQDLLLDPQVYDLNIASSLGSGTAIGIDGPDCQWVFAPPNFESTYAGCQYLDPASTPFGALYPSSNWAQLLAMPTGNAYTYMQANTNGLYLWGSDVNAEGGVTYTTPRTLLRFPLFYNDPFLDSYTLEDSTYNMLRQYSGYGTMTTPVGVFQNVVKILGFEEGTMDFYTTDPIAPLLHFRAGGPIIFFSPTAVGVGDRTSPAPLHVFPNPARESAWIADLTLGSMWQLHDHQGRIVRRGIADARAQIDLTDLAHGSYLLMVTAQGTTRRATVVKQ